MKKSSTRSAGILICAVWLGMLVGCSSAQHKKTVTASYKPGVPGGTYVETYQTKATLIAVNPANRSMVFQAPDGSTNSFVAGPKFMNFDSYQMGETVNVTVARELVTWFPPDSPPPLTDVADLVRGQPGVKPGVLRAATTEVAATVLSVVPHKHEAVMRLSDGREATFKVRPDIDLAKVAIGTTGVIRISAAMAVMLEKP